LVKGVLTAALQATGRAQLVSRFDHLGRWLYPAAMAAVFIAALLL
jgi:hypothetical protein